MRHLVTKSLFALTLFALSATAQAQTYYPNNATISGTVNSDAVVGEDSHGGNTSPTVSVVSPADLQGSLYAYNSSTVNVSGGTLEEDLAAFNSSTVNFSGGTLKENLFAYDSSTVTFSGGTFEANLFASNSSTVTFSGGTFEANLYAYNGSTVNVSGGTLEHNLYAYDNSTVNIYGTNLTASPTTSNIGGFNEDLLNGTLADGTSLNNLPVYIAQGTSASITLINASVPEPGSIALLLGCGVTGLLARRRRK